ncbi:2-oxo acid dehydrogenase subunit E2 [Pontibacterium sp. N1Y112]|uniref:Dihydrolipoamide acetyltransferase component of pyruvate dehydrogenase complex n=1 Tax=Pontibacterium sinense TaxID=2781979 RepID=A0A8J7K0J6_9GAMM|nr:dihydrolipoamide acetyltransferase family protein [Pontibacterium sinense]MBE9399194.1 2-oxo acid dehydrogenase subunit E2 [Pontibacterium sinense]
MKYFKLPDLGEGLPEAEIVEWHIKEGDEVKIDQILVSVETAKAIVEVPSPQDGVIAHLFGAAGDTIHTGEPLIEYISEEDDDTGTVVGEIPDAEGNEAGDDFIIGAAPSTRAHQSARATPAVRALARRLNVDLNGLQGNGRNGAITPEDVEQAASMNKVHGHAEPLRGVRKQMAKTMALAHAEVVPVTLCEDVDIHNWPSGTDVTMRLVNAIAAGCKAEPAINTWFDGASLSRRQHSKIHLGVAVDTDQGLFVPVLRDIGQRSTEELRKGLDKMRADVKARTIPPKELQGATITLSNFGTIAGRYASPVVVPPQVAILGAGVIRDQAVAVDGEVVVRRVLPLSLTFDHRAATGGEAARFMREIIRVLEQDFSEESTG